MSTFPARGRRFPYEVRRRDPNPKSCALLVIDMQNHFSSVALPILPALNTTVDLCRAASIPVVFTRHRHKSPADFAMLGEWWGADDLILEGTPDSELLPDLARRPSDRVVEKHTYSAFRGTGLEEALRGMGVEEVIVTGVMTNLCCETSAREAFVRGFRVFFSTDATGTANADLQESTLKNMAYGFAYLVDCERLKAAFSEVNVVIQVDPDTMQNLHSVLCSYTFEKLCNLPCQGPSRLPSTWAPLPLPRTDPFSSVFCQEKGRCTSQPRVASISSKIRDLLGFNNGEAISGKVFHSHQTQNKRIRCPLNGVLHQGSKLQKHNGRMKVGRGDGRQNTQMNQAIPEVNMGRNISRRYIDLQNRSDDRDLQKINNRKGRSYPDGCTNKTRIEEMIEIFRR